MIARAALAVALVAAAGLPAGGTPVTGKIRAAQAQIHQAHVRLGQKRGELESARARVGSLRTQLDETNRNIASVTASLGTVGTQIDSNRRRLAWNQVQLGAAEATLRRHNDALRRRLVDVYEHGDLGYVNVLLAASSFSDFVERWDEIRYVIHANQDAIHARRDAERQVAGARARLLVSEVALEQAEAEQQQRRNQLAALAQERRNLVAAAQQQSDTVASQVTELEEITAQEEAALETLIREQQRAEAARREADRRAALLAGGPAPPLAGAPGMVGWPVSGPITSPFGYRLDPVVKRWQLHTGVDIAAAQGTTIAAAASGRVIFAGWYGGYGNAIVIDDGGSMSTLYGHCSQIFVGVGQDVQRGQAIGAVGMTGDATGPHVHFEVRIDGKPVDPMSYLH